MKKGDIIFVRNRFGIYLGLNESGLPMYKALTHSTASWFYQPRFDGQVWAEKARKCTSLKSPLRKLSIRKAQRYEVSKAEEYIAVQELRLQCIKNKLSELQEREEEIKKFVADPS